MKQRVPTALYSSETCEIENLMQNRMTILSFGMMSRMQLQVKSFLNRRESG